MKRGKHAVSRRVFFRHTAALSATVPLGALAAGMGAPPAAAAPMPAPLADDVPAPIPPHGAELRGMSLPAKDRSAEGRFGFMFKDLPAFAPPDDRLIALGTQMEEQPTVPPGNTDPKVFDANDLPSASARCESGPVTR